MTTAHTTADTDIDIATMDPVETHGPYNIQRPGSNATFRIPLPAALRKQFEFETGDDLAVRAGIAPDGTLTLRYIPAMYAPDPLPTVSVTVSRSSSAITRIPSAIGQAFGLDTTDDINWALHYAAPPDGSPVEETPERFRTSAPADTAQVPVFAVQTARPITEVDLASSPTTQAPITRQVQEDMQRDNHTWTQEQFRYYLDSEEMVDLGWASGEEVTITIRRSGVDPVIAIVPRRRWSNEEGCVTTTVGGTGAGQFDGLLYLPRTLIRSLDLVGTTLEWRHENGAIFATRG